MARELKTKAPEGRPKRTPIGRRSRLSVKDKDPNYQYRIVNIVDDRIELFLEQGYEIDPQSQVGDTAVDIPSPLGSAKQISVGQGTKAVVMRIRKDWYAEDQAYKQAQIDAVEKSKQDEAKSYIRGQFDVGNPEFTYQKQE